MARDQKWLEVHGLEHWTEFYTDYGVALQKRFFGHFLKGEDTGWDDAASGPTQRPPVDGTFRAARRAGMAAGADAVDDAPPRHRQSVRLATDPMALRAGLVRGAGRQVDVLAPSLSTETMEITGPAAAKLFVASSTATPTCS